MRQVLRICPIKMWDRRMSRQRRVNSGDRNLRHSRSIELVIRNSRYFNALWDLPVSSTRLTAVSREYWYSLAMRPSCWVSDKPKCWICGSIHKWPCLHSHCVSLKRPPGSQAATHKDRMEETEKKDCIFHAHQGCSVAPGPHVANRTVARMTQWLSVPADLPGMVDLVREERVACSFSEASSELTKQHLA